MSQEIWQQPNVILWSQLLLDSYEELLEHPLIERIGNAQEQAKSLFFAPFVVASHGVENEPIFNYGNQQALDLWQLNWLNLTKMPSKNTAESVNQEERAKMLELAKKQGFIDNYQGVRISSTGKRFFIPKAIIWNIFDSQKQVCGQAATFSDWTFLDN